MITEEPDASTRTSGSVGALPAGQRRGRKGHPTRQVSCPAQPIRTIMRTFVLKVKYDIDSGSA
jgi:hypothetical protein